MPREVTTIIQRFSGERDRLAIIIPKKLSEDSAFKLKTGDEVTLKITEKGMSVSLG